ncbi:hypothetical protein CPB83DRAFT_896733 [Crepidotus variabilis]|uniref:DUF6533 domain-containing protein n=1 Tax=Crepidotus variabilis TaxID=179855 RepID=A0A9P6JMN3_9AGAR|nr:hypothetical protein CPB83DRAFT_896733 [Crepidotus variabilis]
MSTASDLAMLAGLFEGLKIARLGNYSAGKSFAAATTLALYDTCARLPDEVQLIWKRQWSLPKLFYLLTRYYGLAYLVVTHIQKLQ